MTSVADLQVKLFADGADKAHIVKALANPLIKGFTTNPTLMRAAGVADYQAFARDVLSVVTRHPISFEVFADDFAEMERQARVIAGWAPNVYVKIPITNTQRRSSIDLVHRLSHGGAKVNVTAILTLEQVRESASALAGGAPSVISVFAGRIADTGIDPVPIMAKAVELLRPTPSIELIWASPRELLNIFQANDVGCHIITATEPLLAKLAVVGKDLGEYSLETVQMFHHDAVKSGFRL